MHTASYLIAVVLGLALTLGAVPAQAETINCTPITAVPFTITAPGIYCLTQDIATNLAGGTAITIAANNVVVDGNAHRLGNLAAGPGTTAYGIHANARENITLKNITVRGFLRGIFIENALSAIIEGIRAHRNTFAGISVGGRGNLIRDNQVVTTGGSTVLSQPYGFEIAGPENQVLNNDVIDTVGTGSAGIIFFSLGPDNLVVNNRITHADYGIYFTAATSGKYRDNLTSGVTTPFSGGTDAGNNN